MLKTFVKGIKFRSPVLTAAGTFGKGYELSESFDYSNIGGIIPKTITEKPRAGNPFPRLVETPCGLINSIGLENEGISSFIQNTYPKLVSLPVRIIASVSGETTKEYVRVLESLVDNTDIGVFEINLSCPNVEKGGEEFSKDVNVLKDLLSEVRAITSKMLWAKLPPDVYGIKSLVEVVRNADIDAVVLSNTYKATYIDMKKLEFSLHRGHGGLSGPAILPISLYIVKEIKETFRDFPVIASGGVFSVDDVIRYLLVGADLVEVGTMNFIKPQDVFSLSDRLIRFMKDRGMTLDEVRGYLLR